MPGNWAPPRCVRGCEWPPKRETLLRSRPNVSWSQWTASADLPVRTLMRSSRASSLAEALVSSKKVWAESLMSSAAWDEVPAPLMPEVALVELPPMKGCLSSRRTEAPRSSSWWAGEAGREEEGRRVSPERGSSGPRVRPRGLPEPPPSARGGGGGRTCRETAQAAADDDDCPGRPAGEGKGASDMEEVSPRGLVAGERREGGAAWVAPLLPLMSVGWVYAVGRVCVCASVRERGGWWSGGRVRDGRALSGPTDGRPARLRLSSLGPGNDRIAGRDSVRTRAREARHPEHEPRCLQTRASQRRPQATPSRDRLPDPSTFERVWSFMSSPNRPGGSPPSFLQPSSIHPRSIYGPPPATHASTASPSSQRECLPSRGNPMRTCACWRSERRVRKSGQRSRAKIDERRVLRAGKRGKEGEGDGWMKVVGGEQARQAKRSRSTRRERATASLHPSRCGRTGEREREGGRTCTRRRHAVRPRPAWSSGASRRSRSSAAKAAACRPLPRSGRPRAGAGRAGQRKSAGWPTRSARRGRSSPSCRSTRRRWAGGDCQSGRLRRGRRRRQAGVSRVGEGGGGRGGI